MKNTNEIGRSKEQLLITALSVKTSLNALFFYPDESKLEIREIDNLLFLKLYSNLINAVCSEINSSKIQFSRLYIKEDNSPDSIDYLNCLIKKYPELKLSELIASSLNNIISIDNILSSNDELSVLFFKSHAYRLLTQGICVLEEYMDFLDRDSGSFKAHPKRVLMKYKTFLDAESIKIKKLDKVIDFLEQKLSENESLVAHRVFRFIENQLVPVEIAPVRSVNDFYGYTEAKNIFSNYFESFANGSHNLPLLLSSLPGLGKTHFSIAYALASENLKLVILPPDKLEKPLENLIKKLSLKNRRKFVLFFDDVDTRKINWYHFRTLIGGTYSLPENITIVIASNFEFPANISSRGRGFTFPVFDEIQCQKMVEDFLLSMGMQHPPVNLISVIAADYVEEFGQKKFEELSPRTLVRYLSDYYKNPQKRIKMLQLSREEMVPKPDAQCFYETNQTIIERLKENI